MLNPLFLFNFRIFDVHTFTKNIIAGIEQKLYIYTYLYVDWYLLE